MGSIGQKRLYRIGVDVGGTNTDAVVTCLSNPSDSKTSSQIEVIASCKSQTTPDVTTGIRNSIQEVIEAAEVPHDAVISVNIGTTHFINAVVQGDPVNLEKVAVLRLCGPFCREVPPFTDYPAQLRGVIEGYSAYLDGGLEIDGRCIRPVNEDEVVAHAAEIRNRNIPVVVIVGIFSPLDTADVPQEEQVKRILQREIPGIDVVCSKDIGRVGFVERENAAILNGSILKFARRTIKGFQKAILDLGLHCPLYLTQNDGTILQAAVATTKPIKTFSSGPTNSLTGAIFLAGIHREDSEINLRECQIIMADIGGTTSDFAALSPSGFPRQASATANIGGVRTAFSMPEVHSIGLGGGSLVQVDDTGKVSVGPISVGHRLRTEALCFGGTKMTATDIVVAQGLHPNNLPSCKIDVATNVIEAASQNISSQLERCIDTMKTSDADVVLLLVGGGSIIRNGELKNVKKCINPPFYKVANAVGAAIAKVSGEVDRIIIPNGRSQADIIEELKVEVVDLAYQNGAKPGSVEVMELELIPLQYTTNNAVRALAKAAGDLEWRKNPLTPPPETQDFLTEEAEQPKAKPTPSEPSATNHTTKDPPLPVNLDSYTPEVSKETGEWFISELDLEFIAEGCGILGTGGGGSVYSGLLHSRELLRSLPAKRMRVVESARLNPDSKIALIAYAGAPSVSNERLISGDELGLASEELSRFLGIKGYNAIMPAEIGGSNGMRPFASAAAMDLPVVDADTMGRAFPKVDMALPYVFGQASPAPAVLSDARGNVQIIARVEDSHRFESIIRSACVELGLYTALSLAPLSRGVVDRYCCLGGISMAWFAGRAICLARKRKEDITKALVGVIPSLYGHRSIANIPKLNVLPGGRLLYKGKVIGVSREIKGGWTIGTATLEPANDEEGEHVSESNNKQLVLSYQNEFFSAVLKDPTGKNPSDILCITPDLITVIDSHNGSALATHELRYGLRVSVIAMPAHPLWMTESGLKAGGPQAFGLEDAYQRLGTEWSEPPSVFRTYAS